MTHPRLFLLRHGETDWNAAGRLLSVTDRPLNARGQQQAADLVEYEVVGDMPARYVGSPRQGTICAECNRAMRPG